jgi:hypothetical protein
MSQENISPRETALEEAIRNIDTLFLGEKTLRRLSPEQLKRLQTRKAWGGIAPFGIAPKHRISDYKKTTKD